MPNRHILIADDVDTEKIGRIRSALDRDPRAVIHVARSAAEALGFIERYGEQIEAAAIDYDFIGECDTGANIIGALRQVNTRARIALVTARDGASYEEAASHASAMGANATFTSTESFEGELGATLSA